MLNRRDFLRATLVTAGAVFTNTGCSDDTDTTPAPAGRVLKPGEAYFPLSVASGDPKADSVILWTRVSDAAVMGELAVSLEMAIDADFKQRVQVNGSEAFQLTAKPEFDHCLKAKVKGLDAGTTYYYRFIYKSAGTEYTSHIGKAKTAPAADADVPVRFAFLSCQDFIGRYYNSYLLLQKEELDFVVFLGDYIYETSGDPSFQTPDEKRKVVFDDTAGAMALGSGADMYYAAKSLDNYRQLYRIYRGDASLQKIHEQYPMICIWDDHEYSNDCYGANANYTNDRSDEKDETRRKAANKAWFEYMPVDYADENFVYDDKKPYPTDLTIYRDFIFGKNVHLVMTDLRSYRPDHLIPESAYPGAVIIDQAFLMAAGLDPAMAGKPYLDIDDAMYAQYKALLVGAATAQEAAYDTSKIKGNIAVDYINSVITAAMSPLPLIDETAQMTMSRGLAYMHLGKTSLNSMIGARYLIVKPTFELYGALKLATTMKASENVMGTDQETWFLDTMKKSASTWKVWGNEFCLIPLQVDLTAVAPVEAFKQRFYMNVDGWDGFRNKRDEIIDQLAGVGNVVAITGDIHAFYAGTPYKSDSIDKRIIEFVGGAVSSQTFRDELISQVASDPVLSTVPGVSELAKAVDDLMMTAINPHMAYAKSDKHGYIVVEANSKEIIATYNQVPANFTLTDYSQLITNLEAALSQERFKSIAGENNLYKDFDGTWKKWDAMTRAWV